MKLFQNKCGRKCDLNKHEQRKIDLLERPTNTDTHKGRTEHRDLLLLFSILSLWSSPLLSVRDNTLSDTLRNFGGFSVIKISAGKHCRTEGKRGDQHHTLTQHTSTHHTCSSLLQQTGGDFDQLNSISGQLLCPGLSQVYYLDDKIQCWPEHNICCPPNCFNLTQCVQER